MTDVAYVLVKIFLGITAFGLAGLARLLHKIWHENDQAPTSLYHISITDPKGRHTDRDATADDLDRAAHETAELAHSGR